MVDLGTRRYPIYIGVDLLDDPNLLRPHLAGKQVMIVSNTTVAPLYLQSVKDLLADGGYHCEAVLLPDGEEHKTLTVWNQIMDALLTARFNRQVTIVALGGGVVGDMAGFAAAAYQRGVSLVQIPTTLLSQVDSSVGGKTGVNHALGKNMIGAFHQPQAVIIDTNTLNTLDDRQLRAGIAEVIKYGLIRDAGFFNWLELNLEGLLQRDPLLLTEAIFRSCQNKAEVVAADELEQGQRALLNFGHTFGHAIETGMGYGEWLHGEAVAAGMVMAAALSKRLGWIQDTAYQRIENLIRFAGLPVVPPPALKRQQFLDLMAVDKKVVEGQLRLVLLQAIGQAVVTAHFDYAQLVALLDSYSSPDSNPDNPQ